VLVWLFFVICNGAGKEAGRIMPTRRYALNRGEPKRLEMLSPVKGVPLTIRLDGQEVGSIRTRDQLQRGQTFLLSDGSKLRVELAKNQLLVLRNGQPVPGSPSDPQVRLRNSYGCLFALAGFVLLVGLGLTILAVTQSVDSTTNQTFADRYGADIFDLGIGALIFGAIYLLLGFFVRRRSKVALGIAVGLIMLNLALNGLTLLAGNCSTLAGLPLQIGVLIILWRGFDAIRELQEESGVTPAQAGATDWEREGQTYYQVGAYSAALAAYERVLARDPRSGRVWRYKGDALAALKRSAEAEQAYQEARKRGEVW
jgi:hypothetical protein